MHIAKCGLDGTIKTRKVPKEEDSKVYTFIEGSLEDDVDTGSIEEDRSD